MCMDWFMRQRHVDSAMTKMHKRLMKQEKLCLHTCSMMLDYISHRLWVLKGKSSYSPTSKYIYSLSEDGD